MNEINSLVGKVFGRLSVIEELPDYFCKCKCSCGAEKQVKKYHLMSGATLSCGCILKEYQASNPRVVELIGKKFGALEVVSFVGKDKKRQAVWECKCECGNTRTVAGTLLTTGNVISCGCMDKQKSLHAANDGTKPCSICKTVKPLSEFHISAACSGGRVGQCKSCLSKKREGTWVMYRYGITKEKVEEMRKAQDGRCAICLRADKKLHVDHCHSTKMVRGLLCNACNVGIGHFGESAETMLRAIEYLKKPDLTVN